MGTRRFRYYTINITAAPNNWGGGVLLLGDWRVNRDNITTILKVIQDFKKIRDFIMTFIVLKIIQSSSGGMKNIA